MSIFIPKCSFTIGRRFLMDLEVEGEFNQVVGILLLSILRNLFSSPSSKNHVSIYNDFHSYRGFSNRCQVLCHVSHMLSHFFSGVTRYSDCLWLNLTVSLYQSMQGF